MVAIPHETQGGAMFQSSRAWMESFMELVEFTGKIENIIERWLRRKQLYEPQLLSKGNDLIKFYARMCRGI